MRRIVSTALTVLMAFSLMLALATTVNANAIAGGGNSSSYSGESVFTNQPAGGSGQFSAIFFNDGSTTWAPGVVGLLICDASKTTCNVASPNAAYASGWFSGTVYSTVSATVPPGSNGFFIYNFVVPAATPAGTSATFNGDVGLISNGLEFRPQGYFQINTTPGASGGMTLSPASASLSVGQTQQFTVSGAPSGATVNWSVTGGCGAVTSAGLFAATSTNSATQPCNVVATAGGSSASAPITVFGPVTQITCSANPTSINGNGADTVVISGTLKDANGNTVSNANGTNVIFNNNTPGLITPTTQQTVGSQNGVATVTYTSAASGTNGTAQVSISSGTLTGCNQTVTVNPVGAATKTVASFNPTTIASDAVSTSRLRVDITDANGNRVTTDNSTVVTANQTNGANVCTPGTFTGTAVSGRVNFYATSTTTPGTCSYTITTNNTSLAGSSATLTTTIVGAPNKLGASVNQSPAQVNCDPNVNNAFTCPYIVITLQDANGARETGPSGQGVLITATWTASGTAGSGCQAMTVWNGVSGTAVGGSGSTIATGATATTAGRSTFAMFSQASTTGCTITFSGPVALAVSNTSGTIAFTPGPATGLTCKFSPSNIAPDGASQATATVNVSDAFGNATNSGTYSVTFQRTAGTSTTLLTSSPQNTSNGVANFQVRSTTTAGTDTYQASAQVQSGTTPQLSNFCVLGVQ